jgi:predicted nucleic acid-binding protein
MRFHNMQVLVDTSVWIDHLHRTDTELVALLQRTRVVMHPGVFGELSCGSIPNRQELLSLWLWLPRVADVSFEETIAFLEQRKLWGRGLGWTDVHLLAATLVSKTMLWTRDRLLQEAAGELLIPLKA